MENDKSSIAFTDNDILFIQLKLSENFILKIMMRVSISTGNENIEGNKKMFCTSKKKKSMSINCLKFWVFVFRYAPPF